MLKIKEIKLEGFRGANNLISVSPGPHITMVHGLNGTGKSSLMQSVEWALFGALPALEGPEFQKEDAIVNLFTPTSKAIVEIVLEDENEEIRVRRERTRGNSTTRGRSSLVVEDGHRYVDPDSQPQLLKALQITADEFGSCVHLHQEAIRDLIQGDPTQRSAAIDRLLGLHDLRTLVANLQVGWVATQAKKPENARLALEEQIIQGSVMLRTALQDRREKILQAGTPESLLTVGGSLQHIVGIRDKVLAKIAELQYESSIPEIGTGTLAELLRAIEKIRQTISALQNHRTTRLADLFKVRAEISEALTKFTQASQSLPEDLEEQVASLASNESSLADSLSELRRANDAGRTSFSETETAVRRAKELEAALSADQSKLDEYVERAGTEDQLTDHVSHLEKDIENLSQLIEQRGDYEQLLSLAVRYLRSAEPSSCPVCQQPFNSSEAVLDMESRLDPAQGSAMNQLQESKAQKSQELARSRVDLRERQVLAKGILDNQTSLDELANANGVARKPGDELSTLLATRAEALRGETDAGLARITSLADELEEVRARLRSLNASKEAIKGSSETLRKQLQAKDESKLEALANERIAQLSSQVEVIEAVGEPIQNLEAEIAMAHEILSYLRQEDDLDKMESQLPEVQRRLTELQVQAGGLHALEAALADIQEVVTAEQESLVSEALDDIVPIAKGYFGRLLGHPVFSQLEIEPVEEKKGTFSYWVKASAGSERSTYIPTRFSTAQMNVVALSLFLAMFERFPHRLGFLLLDDPTQSMDRPHKQALAELLGEFSERTQIVLTTEDEEFREALLAGSWDCRTVLLDTWTTDGVNLMPSQ